MVGRGCEKGFTLTEIVLVITLVGILSAVALVQFQDFRNEAKEAVTKDEMAAIRRGITGDSRQVAGGTHTFQGYEADMAKLPDSLDDLVKNPVTGDKTKDYDPLTRKGWRGPYVDDSSLSDYAKDGWGNDYFYDKTNRKFWSKGKNGIDESGGGDDIGVSF